MRQNTKADVPFYQRVNVAILLGYASIWTHLRRSAVRKDGWGLGAGGVPGIEGCRDAASSRTDLLELQMTERANDLALQGELLGDL